MRKMSVIVAAVAMLVGAQGALAAAPQVQAVQQGVKLTATAVGELAGSEAGKAVLNKIVTTLPAAQASRLTLMINNGATGAVLAQLTAQLNTAVAANPALQTALQASIGKAGTVNADAFNKALASAATVKVAATTSNVSAITQAAGNDNVNGALMALLGSKGLEIYSQQDEAGQNLRKAMTLATTIMANDHLSAAAALHRALNTVVGEKAFCGLNGQENGGGAVCTPGKPCASCENFFSAEGQKEVMAECARS